MQVIDHRHRGLEIDGKAEQRRGQEARGGENRDGAQPEADAADGDLVHRQHGHHQRAGKKIELHQRDRRAADCRVERQVEAFRSRRVGAAHGARSGDMRPHECARREHHPHDQRLLVEPKHRRHTEEAEREAEGPQHVYLADEAQIPLGNDRSRPMPQAGLVSDGEESSCAGALGIGYRANGGPHCRRHNSQDPPAATPMAPVFNGRVSRMVCLDIRFPAECDGPGQCWRPFLM